MEQLETAAKIIAGVMLLILLVYIIFSKRNIIKSVIIKNGAVKADQYYFLPAASMSIKATATIIVTKAKDTNIILAAKLLQIAIENEVKITPDKPLVAIEYEPDIFSNDELKLATSENGLLQTVSTITEDRIINMIARVAEAPKEILPKVDLEADTTNDLLQAEIITETKTYSQAFNIGANRLEKEEEIEQPWKINIDGNTTGAPFEVNASFKLKHKDHASGVTLANSYEGLLSRPMVQATWDVYLQKQKGNTTDYEENAAVSFSALVPDTSVLINTPLKRARFVKATRAPKFNNGVLIENNIIKPSEAEVFLSIPVNIGKAIMSIPAQLFQFKITRNNLQTTYEKSVQELLKAQEATRQQQAEIKKIQDSQLSDIQNKIHKITSPSPAATEQAAQQEPGPQLGKLPAKTAVKEQNDQPLMDIELAVGSPFATPVSPFSRIDNKGITWESYGNESQPICVPAAAANMIKCWTANTLPLKSPSPQEITQIFKDTVQTVTIGSQIKKGCSITDFLEHWKHPGIGSDRITTFIPMNAKNRENVKTAIYYFGGCIIGLQMPLSAKDTVSWELVADLTSPAAAPDSWGGHAVAAFGYTDTHVQVVSWGKVYLMSWKFFEKYNDESVVVLSEMDWSRNGTTPAGGVYTFTVLKQNITSLNQS